MIEAGRAERGARDALFPPIDLAGSGEARSVAAYGPNGVAVAAIVRKAAGFDSLAIERVGLVWALAAEQRDENAVRAAISAVVTDRRDAVRAAFLDGQMAVLVACNPKMGALEYWWNSYPEVPAMLAVGYLAAATVVEDRIAPEALEIARRPFVALEAGLPAGLFGPNHDAVASIVEAASLLTREQARRIERVWSLEPTGDLANFGYPGPLEPARGVGGWMPRRKGRRHYAWIALLRPIEGSIRERRYFELATSTAKQRIRAGGEPRRTPESRGAIEAAVAATLFADLASKSLVADLTEAWRSRDDDAEPSDWWQQNRGRFEHRRA